MPRFSIRNLYFIIVVCPVLTLTRLLRMPLDLFPVINFCSGMPPEDVESGCDQF
jgi:hypothetical protein